MKKKLFVLVIACAVLFVLSACESMIPMPVPAPEDSSAAEESSASTAEGGGEQIPNPWVDCDTLKEAAEIAGFDMEVPDSIEGYSPKLFQAMKGEISQVFYFAGDPEDEETASILIRKGKGTDDISGDYNDYSEEKTMQLYGAEVYVGGVDGLIYKATWSRDGYSYSVGSDSGMALATVDSLVESVK